MKLALGRPSAGAELLFSIDAHDACLIARVESDAGPLEALKRHNAEVAQAVLERWEAAGVPTMRSYLREKVAEASARSGSGGEG